MNHNHAVVVATAVGTSSVIKRNAMKGLCSTISLNHQYTLPDYSEEVPDEASSVSSYCIEVSDHQPYFIKGRDAVENLVLLSFKRLPLQLGC
ncbi:hypothetical protein SLA2020_364890 [Shorea laevis]